MKKLFTSFVIALLGLSQVYGATLYGKVAVGSGKGTATVEIYNGYTIKQDSKSTTGAQVTVSYGMSIVSWGYTKFIAEAETGYTFEAWYTNSACTEGQQTDNPYQTSWTKNEERTDEYWAKFTPNTYKVTFNPEGGSVNPTTKNVTFDATYGEGEGGWPIPTRTGYNFDGWYKSDGTTLVEGTTAVTTASNLALYAHWSPITYKVAFDGNGSTEGSMADQTFTYDEEAKNLSANAYAQKYTVQFDAKVSEVAPLVSQSTFIGWATSAAGEKVYDNEQSVSNLTTEHNATIQLSALWNAGSVVLPAVQKEGYQFEGWFLNDVKIGDAGFEYVPTANATLAAHWTSFGVEEIFFCAGGSVEYNGKTYTAAASENVTLSIKNQFGGDSIVALTVTVLQPTYGEDTKTIVLGAEESWNGIDLSTYGLGTHDVPFETTNVAGCDSVVTLHLTVIKSDAVVEDVELEFCQGGSVEYRDRTYTEAGTDVINITGDERDTVINVTIIELLPSASEDEMTIVYGADEEWNGIALKDSTVGVHYVVYETTNAAGCDSIVTLTLTVTKQEAFVEERQLEFCEGDSVEYRGKVYTEAGEDSYEIEGATRDTLVVVTIAVNPNAYEKLEQTVLSGHEIVLPAGEWMIGEETVSGTYPTVKSGETTTLTFFQYGQTEKGCEDVKELVVTVESNTEAVDNIFVGEKAEKVFRNGVLYIRRGERIFTCEGREVK